MSRTLLEILLFAAPFVIYAIYLLATERDAREKEHWRLNVLSGLAFVGCLLVIASLIAFAHFGGYAPGGTYVPAHMENGRLVPGGFK
jgi:heme/copper-type cytochrome/quinol oxidase subunit 1